MEHKYIELYSILYFFLMNKYLHIKFNFFLIFDYIIINWNNGFILLFLSLSHWNEIPLSGKTHKHTRKKKRIIISNIKIQQQQKSSLFAKNISLVVIYAQNEREKKVRELFFNRANLLNYSLIDSLQWQRMCVCVWECVYK